VAEGSVIKVFLDQQVSRVKSRQADSEAANALAQAALEDFQLSRDSIIGLQLET
jgi:hypothetical protein